MSGSTTEQAAARLDDRVVALAARLLSDALLAEAQVRQEALAVVADAARAEAEAVAAAARDAAAAEATARTEALAAQRAALAAELAHEADATAAALAAEALRRQQDAQARAEDAAALRRALDALSRAALHQTDVPGAVRAVLDQIGHDLRAIAGLGSAATLDAAAVARPSDVTAVRTAAMELAGRRRVEEIVGTSNASAVVTITFAAFAAPPLLLPLPVWTGTPPQRVDWEQTAVTTTSATLTLRRTRATVLLNASPYEPAPNTAIRLVAVGDKPTPTQGA